MIGGTDAPFRVLDSAVALERAVKALLRHWPRGVIEDALTGDSWKRVARVPFGRVSEILVYQTEDDARRWDAEGAVPDLKNTMVQFIRSQGELTVVADDFTRPELIEVTCFLRVSAHGMLEHTQPTLLRAP